MKSNFIIFILALFLSSKLFAENLFIEAKDITLNKDQETTVFRNSVTIKTKDKQITSQFAEYNKKTQEIVLKGNITAKDKLNISLVLSFLNSPRISKNIIESEINIYFETTCISSASEQLGGVKNGNGRYCAWTEITH